MSERQFSVLYYLDIYYLVKLSQIKYSVYNPKVIKSATS